MDVTNVEGIPKKSSFKSEDVCRMVGIRPYVLRFWESEFSEICPIVSDSGQKIYERKDIELVLLIKRWIFGEKLTVEQVKKRIYDRSVNHNSASQQKDSVGVDPEKIKNTHDYSTLSTIKKELLKVQLSLHAIQKRNNWS